MGIDKIIKGLGALNHALAYEISNPATAVIGRYHVASLVGLLYSNARGRRARTQSMGDEQHFGI